MTPINSKYLHQTISFLDNAFLFIIRHSYTFRILRNVIEKIVFLSTN